MIDHLENGFLASSRNIESMAEGIKMFKESNIRTSAGTLAREKIVKVFAEEVIANNYASIYEEALSAFNN